MWRKDRSIIQVKRLRLTVQQPVCEGSVTQPSFTIPGFFSDAMNDTPHMVWWTQTTVSTTLVTTGAPDITPSPSNVYSTDSFRSAIVISPSLLTARSTTASQPTIMSSALPPQVPSIVSLHNEGQSLATPNVIWGPPLPTGKSSGESSLSTDAVLGTVSSLQPPSSSAAAAPISISGPYSSPPLYTSYSMTATATTRDAATIFSTLITPAQSSISAISSPLQSMSPSTIIDPTVATTPPCHTTLSTAAKSGIAISAFIIAAFLLLSTLAFLWRKRRSAETERRNDIEAKAIWVTKTFAIETQARSSDSGGGSPQSLNQNSIIPVERTTFPSEDAKVAKQWEDVDMIGGMRRWSKARKGVHEL